jgi:hypothetical protein
VDGALGVGEGQQDRVSDRVDLAAAEVPGDVAEQLAMGVESVRVLGAELVEGLGRTLDVGKEERHDLFVGWVTAHRLAIPITRSSASR